MESLYKLECVYKTGKPVCKVKRLYQQPVYQTRKPIGKPESLYQKFKNSKIEQIVEDLYSGKLLM